MRLIRTIFIYPVKKQFYPSITITTILVLLISISSNVLGQSAPNFSVNILSDSLTSSSSSPVLYNTVSVTNHTAKEISIELTVALPEGWRQIGGKGLNANKIAPNETRKMALNLVKSPIATADWKTVVVKAKLGADSAIANYKIRTEAVHSYIAYSVIDNVELEERPDKNVYFELYVKNTGNVTEDFNLQWVNKKLKIDENTKLTLAPRQDTIYKYPVRLTGSEWRELYKEVVGISLKPQNGRSYSGTYQISRKKTEVKENKSGYTTVPLSVGGGTYFVGNNFSYFGFVNGHLKFGPQHNLTFSYTSKPYGQTLNGFQQDIIIVDYNINRWNIGLGQISIPQYFNVAGNGMSVAYKADNAEYGLRGMLHHPKMPFPGNDNFSGYAKYKIGKLSVSTTAMANINHVTAENSYLVDNEISILTSKSLKLSADVGVGMNELTSPSAKGKTDIKPGIKSGYNLTVNKRYWSLASSVRYASTDFPGLLQGTLYQMHSISRKFGRFSTGVFLSSSIMDREFYIDTNYNTASINNRFTRVGLRNKWTAKMSSTKLDIGVQKSIGPNIFYGVGQSLFADAANYYRFGPFSSLNTSANVSYNGSYGEKKQKVYTVNASSSFNNKFGGANISYYQMPVMNYTDKSIEENISVINGGPYVRYNLFSRAITGTFSYNFVKSSDDQFVRQNVGASIGYYSAKNGLSIQGNVVSPLFTDPTMNNTIGNSRSGRMTIRKDLNVPVITSKRKYYDLKLVLYEDKNNNNQIDLNEKKLDNAHVNIGDEYLVSNSQGEIRYRNIENKDYNLNMLNVKTEDDLIPVEGPMQAVTVENNTVVEIPFKKGKLITGHISVFVDSFSNTTFTPDYVKVTATDTSGRTYTTLTDATGDFYFVVPAGIFSLSLNPSSFAGTAFVPLRTAYDIDLMNNNESIVTFQIEQKKRKVRFLQADASDAKKDD